MQFNVEQGPGSVTSKEERHSYATFICRNVHAHAKQATRRGHSQKENGGRSSRVVQSTSEIEPPAHQGVNGLHSEARAIAEPRALNSSPSFGPPNFIPQSDDHETQRDLAQDEQRGGGTRTHGHEASADTDVDVESTATDADQGPRHPKDDMERSREDMARTPCVASSVELVAERGKADGRKCFTDRSLTGKANTAELGAGSPNSSPRTTGQNAPSAVEHQPPSRLMKDPIASNVKSSKRAEEDDDHHQVDVGGGGNDPPLGRAARGSYRITWRGRDVLVPQCSVKVVDATGKFVSARACPGESMDRLSSSRSSGVWRRSSPGEGRQRIKLEEEPNDPDGRVLSRTYLSAGPDFVREDDDRSEEKGVEHDAYRRRDEGRGTHAKAAAPESATLRGSFSTEIERMRHDDGERHRPRSSQVHDDEPERSSPLPHKRPEIKYKSCSPLPSLPARGQRYRRCSIQHGRLDCGEAPRQGGGSRQGSHPGYCPQVPVYFSATPYMGPPVSACPRAWAGNKVVREMHDACATATLPGRRSFPRRNPSSREAPDCHETGVDNPERVRAEHPRVAVHDDTGEQLTESDGKSGNDRYRGDMSSHGYKRTSGDDFDGCSSEAQAKDTAERQRFPHKCDDTADMKAKATWDK